MISIIMSEKTLKFNNIKLNKKKFHQSKQAIDLDSVITDKIVVSDKFKHSEECYKYFIGYQEDEIIRPLCIILPQMNDYIKYFENGGKNVSLLIKNNEVQERYEEIQNVVKNKLNIKFHSEPIYENKYLKAKVTIFFFFMKDILNVKSPNKSIYVTLNQIFLQVKKASK